MISLRWKLVGLYAAILILVITAFSIVLAVSVRQSLVESIDHELEARAQSIVPLVEFEKDMWFIEPKTGLVEEYGQGTGRYYMLSHNNKVVLASAIANSAQVSFPATDQTYEVKIGKETFRQVARSILKLRDAEEGGPPVPVRIACGKSLAHVEASMASLINQLLMIAPFALLISMAGGLLLVSRALRPIDRMARTAEKISATDLTQRIDAGGNDELARLGKTLNEMFARLQESFDRQTRFTADASHELRTPLSVIAGNVELALKRERSAEEYHDILLDISESTERMRSIVEGLLTLARADAKTIALKREPVSLTAISDEIVRLYKPLAEKQNVIVIVESEGDVVVTGDKERLKELISNLVTNAIRYNKPNGKVTVKLASDQGRGVLTVDDTGIGIPSEDLPHIFERFYRVDKARSRDIGGFGLGLAIAKWIAEAHNGQINVTSQIGKGSRFIITLPV